MTAQRKRIFSNNISSNLTEIAQIVCELRFLDTISQNIHGVNITFGVTPFGPEETLVGRWYVIILSRSIADDTAIRNAWIANLNNISLANDALESSEFVWGAGTIVCSD